MYYKSHLPFSRISLALLEFRILIQIFVTDASCLKMFSKHFKSKESFVFQSKYFTVTQDVKQIKSRVVLVEQRRKESMAQLLHTSCSMVPPEALLQPPRKAIALVFITKHSHFHYYKEYGTVLFLDLLTLDTVFDWLP